VVLQHDFHESESPTFQAGEHDVLCSIEQAWTDHGSGARNHGFFMRVEVGHLDEFNLKTGIGFNAERSIVHGRATGNDSACTIAGVLVEGDADHSAELRIVSQREWARCCAP
jgi:hypothetical protein